MQLKNQIFYCIGFTHSFIHNSPMSLSFDFCLFKHLVCPLHSKCMQGSCKSPLKYALHVV